MVAAVVALFAICSMTNHDDVDDVDDDVCVRHYTMKQWLYNNNKKHQQKTINRFKYIGGGGYTNKQKVNQTEIISPPVDDRFTSGGIGIAGGAGGTINFDLTKQTDKLVRKFEEAMKTFANFDSFDGGGNSLPCDDVDDDDDDVDSSSSSSSSFLSSVFFASTSLLWVDLQTCVRQKNHTNSQVHILWFRIFLLLNVCCRFT